MKLKLNWVECELLHNALIWYKKSLESGNRCYESTFRIEEKKKILDQLILALGQAEKGSLILWDK